MLRKILVSRGVGCSNGHCHHKQQRKWWELWQSIERWDCIVPPGQFDRWPFCQQAGLYLREITDHLHLWHVHDGTLCLRILNLKDQPQTFQTLSKRPNTLCDRTSNLHNFPFLTSHTSSNCKPHFQ